MGKSIDHFKSRFDDGARSNRFHVNFHCPSLDLKLEGWRVESCNLPGRQIQVEQFSTYGPLVQFPYNIDHDGGQMTTVFRCDSNFIDRALIEFWQDSIFSGEHSDASLERGNSAKPVFNYYEEYVGEMEIFQLRRNDKNAMRYKLHEVYPLSYAPMELNSTSTDQLLTFSVTWAFRTFSVEISDPPELSLLNKGRRFLDVALDTLKVASRYNKKSGSYLNRLEQFDNVLSSGQQLARAIGGGGG